MAESKSRYPAIDALRGTVMIIMALDHIREFFHIGAMSFQPENLARTTAALFLTRWITHFCAPVFMFTAGMGAYFWWQRNHTKAQLSTFLLTRGLWLLFLEVTVMRLALNFNFSGSSPVLLLVLWALGSSMIILAALVHLPIRLLAVLSIAVIALHNCLDGTKLPVLHQPGAFPLAGWVFVVGYPLIPWFAVMSAGFCFGAIYRREVAMKIGLALTIAFVVIRTANIYGDPVPWSVQSSGVFTALSFLRCLKYPPSLDFLLMTLGPALMFLAWLDRRRLSVTNPLIVFGRVPLFYFVVHFYVVHIVAILMAWLRYGQVSFMLNPLPSMGGSPKSFPPNFGYDLWVVYVVWVVIVASLYPLCRWFAGVKARRRDWWLSYL
jgi:uncharacterized membrane protein